MLHQFDSPAATAGGGGPVRRLEDMIRNLNVPDISTTPPSSPVVVIDVVVFVWRVVSVSVRALRSVSGRGRITAAAAGVTVVPVAATVLVTPESTQTINHQCKNDSLSGKNRQDPFVGGDLPQSHYVLVRTIFTLYFGIFTWSVHLRKAPFWRSAPFCRS